MRFRNLTVRNCFVNRGGRHDQRQAAAAEFARITYDNRAAGRFRHDAVDPSFQQVRGRKAVAHIKAIDSEEEKIGAQPAQRFLGKRTDERERIFSQCAACQDDLDGSSGKRGCDVCALVMIVSCENGRRRERWPRWSCPNRG